MDDRDIILKRKFETLFRDHFTSLCYFARRYTGDPDTAKEIVHGVFIRIWENRLQFDWEKPAKSYLFTSVFNRSLNLIRDKRRFIPHDEAVTQHLIKDEPEFQNNLEAAELESRIKSALERLPAKCREIFELSRFEGRKYAEIAELLQISVKTVETQMSKALQSMKEDLRDYLTLLLLLMIRNMN